MWWVGVWCGCGVGVGVGVWCGCVVWVCDGTSGGSQGCRPSAARCAPGPAPMHGTVSPPPLPRRPCEHSLPPPSYLFMPPPSSLPSAHADRSQGRASTLPSSIARILPSSHPPFLYRNLPSSHPPFLVPPFTPLSPISSPHPPRVTIPPSSSSRRPPLWSVNRRPSFHNRPFIALPPPSPRRRPPAALLSPPADLVLEEAR